MFRQNPFSDCVEAFSLNLSISQCSDKTRWLLGNWIRYEALSISQCSDKTFTKLLTANGLTITFYLTMFRQNRGRENCGVSSKNLSISQCSDKTRLADLPVPCPLLTFYLTMFRQNYFENALSGIVEFLSISQCSDKTFLE